MTMTQLVRIFCKADEQLKVAIRDNHVVLAREDPHDKTQQWFKDHCGTGNLMDDHGRKPFALVNKATGQVILASELNLFDPGTIPVSLTPYEADERVSIGMLWSDELQDDGDGFRQVKPLGNLSKCLDAMRGYEPVREGIYIGVFAKPHGGTNQYWKMIPV